MNFFFLTKFFYMNLEDYVWVFHIIICLHLTKTLFTRNRFIFALVSGLVSLSFTGMLSTYMGGNSYNKHYCVILLVQIQGPTSPSFSMKYFELYSSEGKAFLLFSQGHSPSWTSDSFGYPKNILFFDWLVYSYIWLPQIINIELPQTNSIVKNYHK